MRRIIALITVAAMMVLAASPAQGITLHRHLLTTPGTSGIEVAQGICKQGLLEPALVNVHEHFHEGKPVTQAFAENPVDEDVAGC